MVHKRDVPKSPPAIVELSEEIDRLREQKSMYFKLCPPRVKIEDPTIHYCREPTSNLIFVDEELRNFHYNRIHKARDLLALRKLEESPEEAEERLYGFECMKAACETRAMTQELRDFHVQKERSKVWAYVQEILDDEKLLYPKRTEKEKEEVFDQTTRDTHPELGPRQTTQESIFIQKDSRYTTGTSSVADAEEVIEKLDALKEDKSEATIEKVDLDPRSNEFKEKEFGLTDRPNRATIYPRSRAYFMMSRNAMANPGATMWRPQLNEERKEDLSSAPPVSAELALTAKNTIEKKIASMERLNRATLHPRPRAYFMMSRNAMANPGASMWCPQPQEEAQRKLCTIE